MSGTLIDPQSTPPDNSTQDRLQQQIKHFENLSLLKNLLEIMPDVILILNQDRQIVFANSTIAELSDLSVEELLRGLRPGEALQCVHALQDGICGATKFCQTCGANQAILSTLRGNQAVEECRITRVDGVSLDLRVWGKPLWVNGQLFTVFVAQDISHEKRRQALERIFFHDVLNTAGALYGYVGLLKYAPAEELDELSDQLDEITQRLIDEIQSQRELSRAENGELHVEPVLVDSLLLLYSLAGSYANHAVAQGRSIVVDPASEALEFTTDHTLLGRAIGNMVKNALEACPEGQTVTLFCGPCETGVEFSVHNPGCMPTPVQMQIFQRSFSTKGPGRGLGTYSMKLLTEQYLHGDIRFTSSAEFGTTFIARYPLGLPVPAAQV